MARDSQRGTEDLPGIQDMHAAFGRAKLAAEDERRDTNHKGRLWLGLPKLGELFQLCLELPMYVWIQPSRPQLLLRLLQEHLRV